MIGITGSSGVLGAILTQKYQEIGVSVSLYQYDIADVASLYSWLTENNIKKVIHLAAKVAISKVTSELANAYEVNVGGVISLIKAIELSKSTIHVFYASSSHVYESKDFALKETDIIKPINSYGLTKYVGEELLKDFADKNAEVTVCVGRIFSFYHTTQKKPFLYPSLLERLSVEDLTKPFLLYGSNSSRDFLNAEHVCDYIIKLMKIRYEGIVNIGSGQATLIKDFVRSLSDKPMDIKAYEGDEPNHLVADISKLKSILAHET